jgi:hypothetical protein
VTIEDPAFLRTKFIIREAVLKHEDNFKTLTSNIPAEKSLHRSVLQERLIDQVFKLNN